jgi:hypothetical protein
MVYKKVFFRRRNQNGCNCYPSSLFFLRREWQSKKEGDSKNMNWRYDNGYASVAQQYYLFQTGRQHSALYLGCLSQLLTYAAMCIGLEGLQYVWWRMLNSEYLAMLLSLFTIISSRKSNVSGNWVSDILGRDVQLLGITFPTFQDETVSSSQNFTEFSTVAYSSSVIGEFDYMRFSLFTLEYNFSG